MFKQGRLLRDIVPDDQVTKEFPRKYSRGSMVDINPLGFYVTTLNLTLNGWLYKNLTTKEMNKDLEEGIDYELL